jgi:hypothetical protein
MTWTSQGTQAEHRRGIPDIRLRGARHCIYQDLKRCTTFHVLSSCKKPWPGYGPTHFLDLEAKRLSSMLEPSERVRYLRAPDPERWLIWSVIRTPARPWLNPCDGRF